MNTADAGILRQPGSYQEEKGMSKMNEGSAQGASSFKKWLLKRDVQRVLVIVTFMAVPLIWRF